MLLLILGAKLELSLDSLKVTSGSIIALNPFLLTIIDSCESSALIQEIILDFPIADVRNPQIEPSKIGVESMADSPKRIVLNLRRYSDPVDSLSMTIFPHTAPISDSENHRRIFLMESLERIASVSTITKKSDSIISNA